MKKYDTPVTEILEMDSFSVICGSKIDREYEISDPSGNNPNQNPDWYDDGDIDDDGELNSTAKDWGDLWGDLGF